MILNVYHVDCAPAAWKQQGGSAWGMKRPKKHTVEELASSPGGAAAVTNSDRLFRAGFETKRSRGGGRKERGSASHQQVRKRSRRWREDWQAGPGPRPSPRSAMYWGWTAREAAFWLLISWPCSKGWSSGPPQKGNVRQ